MVETRHFLTKDLADGPPDRMIAQFVVGELEDELERHAASQRRRQSLRFERRGDVPAALAFLSGQGAAAHRRLSNAPKKRLCCSRRCVHGYPALAGRYISRSPVRIL